QNVEKAVAIDVEYIGSAETPWGDVRAGFEGKLTITREEFGVGWTDIKYRPPLIGNEVEITLNLELVKSEG
ncbi:MAG: YceI family protein, partial [Candidatus Eisenbacteria bacterium]